MLGRFNAVMLSIAQLSNLFLITVRGVQARPGQGCMRARPQALGTALPLLCFEGSQRLESPPLPPRPAVQAQRGLFSCLLSDE